MEGGSRTQEEILEAHTEVERLVNGENRPEFHNLVYLLEHGPDHEIVGVKDVVGVDDYYGSLPEDQAECLVEGHAWMWRGDYTRWICICCDYSPW